MFMVNLVAQLQLAGQQNQNKSMPAQPFSKIANVNKLASIVSVTYDGTPFGHPFLCHMLDSNLE